VIPPARMVKAHADLKNPLVQHPDRPPLGMPLVLDLFVAFVEAPLVEEPYPLCHAGRHLPGTRVILAAERRQQRLDPLANARHRRRRISPETRFDDERPLVAARGDRPQQRRPGQIPLARRQAPARRVSLATIADVDIHELPFHRREDHERIGVRRCRLVRVEREADRARRTERRHPGCQLLHLTHCRDGAPGDVLYRQRHPRLVAHACQVRGRRQERLPTTHLGELFPARPVPDDGPRAEAVRGLDRLRELRPRLLGATAVRREEGVQREKGMDRVDADASRGGIGGQYVDEGRLILPGGLQKQLDGIDAEPRGFPRGVLSLHSGIECAARKGEAQRHRHSPI